MTPSFGAFYRELHGFDPFPWQARLAALVARQGWPKEIGVPTGLGKTSCLDIAVWSLANQADVPPSERTAPTRIWWVVNRRLLVDATAEHADRLQVRLQQRGGAIGAVGERLRTLLSDPAGDPLQVVRLRGGIETERPVDPAQPAILLSTVPMYGSRLLFRGYGSSRSMRPIDAAHAGTDALVLVDEAHLAHHLSALFSPIEECDRHEAEVLAPRARPHLVALTATGSADEADRLDLDEDDRRHPVVAQRLHAAKPLRLREVSHDRLDATLADEALDRVGRNPGTSCVVFVNTPARARAVAGRVEKLGAEVDLVVVTGAQRDREAEAARRHVLDPSVGARAGRATDGRDRSLLVVATQTLEVGADLDFEHLVTEACGVRSLTQRLGRVNRLGTFAHASVTYVHAEPKARGTDAPSWPVYGEEPMEVVRRLRAALASDCSDVVSVEPDLVGELLGRPGDDPGRAPELLPALLWEWVKTTTPPPGEAPVEPYFSGLAQPSARVSICWRTHLPDDGQRLWPKVRDREIVEGSLVDARAVVDGLLESGLPVGRLTSDRVSVERLADARLKPGDVLVLPTDAGHLDRHGWNPAEGGGPVGDVSLVDQGLPLDEAALARLVQTVPVAELLAVLHPTDPDGEADAVSALATALAAATPVGLTPEEWTDLVASLDLAEGVASPPGEVPHLVVRRPGTIGRVDAFDELSAGAVAATDLEAHGKGVGQKAAAVGRAIGLSDHLVETVARAAELHDIGKADPRFQRWLDPGAEAGALLAKSASTPTAWAAHRHAAGWPRGGRHEALSARLVTAWLAQAGPAAVAGVDSDLLLHLVVSHHGHARPLLLPADDGTTAEVSIDIDGTTVSAPADLSQVDWDQPSRFARLNRRYGSWGLALLEAVVRQSDHVVSAGHWASADQEVI